MSNATKMQVFPRLRFPEFRKLESWRRLVLQDVFERITSRNHENNQNVLTISAQKGLISQFEYFKKQIASKNLSGYYLIRKGDFAYNKSYSQGYPMGAIKPLKAYERGIVSSLYICFRTKTGFNASYFEQYFDAGLLNAQIGKIAQEGARNHGLLNIGVHDFFERLFVLVPEPREQQTIADCLSSLDDLITAQTDQVGALKQHKKGLLQQLFPQEGESVPRLRFPEFADAGEWEKKPFSELCDIKHGYAFEGEFFSNEGDHVLLTPGNFFELGGYRDQGTKQKYFIGEIPPGYVLNFGDLLVAMTEQAAGLLGSPILVPDSNKFLHNQRLGLVVGKPGVAWTNEFFFYVFNTSSVRKAIHDTASGAKVRHTSPAKIGEVVVSFPTELAEQRRIAAFFSSIDDQIKAQIEELESLKSHKHALIQQLFPASAECDDA